ncbi:MAG: adenosylcobinamide-GDP ribazoletransferase [Methanobacteriaceae archaeon]
MISDNSQEKSAKKPVSSLKEVYQSIGGIITFSTIIPIKIYPSIETIAKATWFWPIISGFVGLIGAIIAYGLSMLLVPPIVSATIIYSFFIMFNGFHHLDGLIDFGDALMAHGSHEKKLSIMRDERIGTGGIGLFFIVGIISIACLNSIFTLPLFTICYSIIIAELSGKLGLVTCCISSKTDGVGMGSHFIKSMALTKYLLILTISLAIGILLLGFTGVFGVLGGVLGGAFVAYLGKKNIGMANGDVLGASNEIGRLFSLLAIVISFFWFL